MSSPSKERIAAVLGVTRQGSGYLLTPRLVLTAAHVVVGSDSTHVTVPGGRGRIPCRLVWDGTHENCDAALLLADDDLVAPDLAADWTPVRWGQTSDLRPRPNCQAIGYPDVQRGGSGQLDSEQLIGTLKPGSNMVRGGYTVDLDHTPPAPQRGGGSPWAGMSGAALFDGELLLGVVTTDPVGWQHGRLTAVPATAIHIVAGFYDAYLEHFGKLPRLEEAGRTRTRAPRVGFESDYRSYVEQNYGELRIFGLDFSRGDHAQWPLDTAYLSLELSQQSSQDRADFPEAAPRHEVSSGRRRVEAALSGRTRVLLRGLAGSGKTTLVQWLAITAARDEFSYRLGHLDDSVPFVLPLRTLVRRGELPGPADFLAATGIPLTPPPDWAEQVMRSGRALLLIDGVDEIPERDRERTQQWLTGLLAAYPDCNCVITTRPTAVSEGWLTRRDFTELNLLPMNQQDVEAFVQRWHLAAFGESAEAAPERDRYAERLLDTLRRKRDLARLATNPLMCAMICALHRDRRTYLPESRMELYGAALTMLLVRRDKERDVGAPEGFDIPEDAQRQLLQEFAWWLIRNGQTEAEQDRVVRLIERLLPAMPAVAPPERARDVLRHLVRRSGLLREPTPQTVDFVHRTFQDFLGAKAAVEAQDLPQVAQHAADPQWEDVVRMAVGHGRPEERAMLIGGLLDRGDAAKDDEIRTRLHLLAAASLEHATMLAPEVRSRAEARAAALVPPRDSESAEKLASAGPVVLDLLPGPDQLDDREAAATAETAGRIGGEHAFQILRQLRDHPNALVRKRVVEAWSSFDDRRFANEILSGMDLADTRVTVGTDTQLAALDRVGRVRTLELKGSFPGERMVPGLLATKPRDLRLVSNDSFRDLGFLADGAPCLRSLELVDCGSLTDYSGISDVSIWALRLDKMPVGPDMSPLAESRELTFLSINSRQAWGTLTDMPLPSGLRALTLGPSTLRVPSLDGIERWPRLESLWLALDAGSPFAPDELRKLVALTELRELDIALARVSGLAELRLPPLPHVQSLRLAAEVGSHHLRFDEILAVFPGLRRLTAQVYHRSFTTLDADVSALRAVPASAVTIDGSGKVRLTGEKGLPSGSHVVIHSDHDEHSETDLPRVPLSGTGKARFGLRWPRSS